MKRLAVSFAIIMTVLLLFCIAGYFINRFDSGKPEPYDQEMYRQTHPRKSP